MSIRMLRTLVAVANHRTFSAAAESIQVTHAAVSQQMRGLEEKMGIQIFDRKFRTPVLTADGLLLVEKARRLLEDYDLMVPSILDRNVMRGEIVIGSVPLALVGLLPVLLMELRLRFPDLKVRIWPAESDNLLADMQRGLVDVAILTRPVRIPELTVCQPLASERLHLVTSRDLRSGPAEELLAANPFIRLSRTTMVGTMIGDWLQDTGIAVNEVMELRSPDSIMNMVSSGLGVTILPRPCVLSPVSVPLNWIDLGLRAPERRLELGYLANTSKLGMISTIYQVVEEILMQERPGQRRLKKTG